MSSALRHVRNQLRPLYWRLRFSLLNLPPLRRHILSRKLTRRLDGPLCSVCRSSEIWEIRFFSERWIDKCWCASCRHIFSRHLNRDVARASTIFGYDRPNDQFEGQKRLQQELVRQRQGGGGRFLDFGVGGNLGIAGQLAREHPEHQFFAADIYPSSQPHYFQLYAADAPVGAFDGVSSNAVIEHLDNTIEAWRYLNQLLKPMAGGGGIMIHAFPSQVVEDLDHWAIKIASHECLFSPESLALVCRTTGFDSMGWRYFGEVQHPVHYFRKVRDLP